MKPDLILVGCGKSKADEPRPAAELYTGALTQARIAYAKASGVPFLILSGKFGAVEPDRVLEPYDRRVPTSGDDGRAWAIRVDGDVRLKCADLVGLVDVTGADGRVIRRTFARRPVIELHAGADYRVDRMDRWADVVWPVEGLQVGEQLQFYAKKAAAGLSVSVVPGSRAGADFRAVVCADDRDGLKDVLVAGCRHSHRTRTAAVECGRRLMREVARGRA